MNERVKQIIRDRMMQKLKFIWTVKEVSMTILNGEVYKKARLESVTNVLIFARSRAEFRFE